MPLRDNVWHRLEAFETMEGCCTFIKEDLEDQEGKTLCWKTEPRFSHGRTRKAFRCMSHVDCPVLVRAVKDGDEFSVQYLEGAVHSKEVATKFRSNATLTLAQDEDMRKALNRGTRPKALLADWTSDILDEQAGMPAALQKHEEGGLKGEH